MIGMESRVRRVKRERGYAKDIPDMECLRYKRRNMVNLP